MLRESGLRTGLDLDLFFLIFCFWAVH